jgi:hypothetical protein
LRGPGRDGFESDSSAEHIATLLVGGSELDRSVHEDYA